MLNLLTLLLGDSPPPPSLAKRRWRLTLAILLVATVGQVTVWAANTIGMGAASGVIAGLWTGLAAYWLAQQFIVDAAEPKKEKRKNSDLDYLDDLSARQEERLREFQSAVSEAAAKTNEIATAMQGLFTEQDMQYLRKVMDRDDAK